MPNSLAILIHGTSYRDSIPILPKTMSPENTKLVDNYCTRCYCKPAPAWPDHFRDLHNNLKYSIDFRETFPMFEKNVLNFIKPLFNTVDIYIITYDHQYINELKTMVNPKETKIMIRVHTDLLPYGIQMIKDTEIKYNNILVVRFDNYYPIPFPIEKLKLNMVNIPWNYKDEVSKSFIMCPFDKIDRIHNELTNELCERLDKEGEYYPNFMFPQRRIRDYSDKKLQLVQISVSGEVNWCMLMANVAHTVIITSCINVDSSPLCYYPIRSYYTAEERLHQTFVSIETVREKIPNVTIVLVNNNKLTHEQHAKLLERCDYVFIFDSICLDTTIITADFVKSFPNKSCSETASLYYACKRINEMGLEYDYLWKLSGRTYLKPEFNIEDWPPLEDKITTPPRGHGINNSLYNIPKQMVPYYMSRLKYCCLQCYNDSSGSNNSMVEWTLFETAHNPDSPTHYFIPCLAQIAGLATVDDSHTHWTR